MVYESPHNWYEGGWVEDLKQGEGVRTYGSGDRYKGEWWQDQQHSNGIMIWDNNDVNIKEVLY